MDFHLPLMACYVVILRMVKMFTAHPPSLLVSDLEKHSCVDVGGSLGDVLCVITT